MKRSGSISSMKGNRSSSSILRANTPSHARQDFFWIIIFNSRVELPRIGASIYAQSKHIITVFNQDMYDMLRGAWPDVLRVNYSRQESRYGVVVLCSYIFLFSTCPARAAWRVVFHFQRRSTSQFACYKCKIWSRLYVIPTSYRCVTSLLWHRWRYERVPALYYFLSWGPCHVVITFNIRVNKRKMVTECHDGLNCWLNVMMVDWNEDRMSWWTEWWQEVMVNWNGDRMSWLTEMVTECHVDWNGDWMSLWTKMVSEYHGELKWWLNVMMNWNGDWMSWWTEMLTECHT